MLQNSGSLKQGAIYTLYRENKGAMSMFPSHWQFSSTVSVQDFLSLLQLHYPGFTIHNSDAFYCDLSHKIRHGGAKLFGLFVNKRLQSAACASFIYHTDIVLSAVVTAGQSRRKGYATALLRYAVQECNTCFVQVEDKSLYPMYEKLGFIQQGSWGEAVF